MKRLCIALVLMAACQTAAAAQTVSFLVEEPSPQVLMSIHGPINQSRFSRLRQKLGYEMHSPITMQHVNIFNSVGSAILTGLQLAWYLKNWQIGKL